MSANQAVFPVAVMARVLGVSKAGFYAWRLRPPSTHCLADLALLKRIKAVHASSRQTYGAPRVHAELRTRGQAHGRKRIARLMREAGLVGASHRRGGHATTRRDKDARPTPDLVDRNFTATAPNHLRAVLVLDAMEMAVGQRRPKDVIYYSDQGSQYTSVAVGKRCGEAGVRPSMGSVGDAYDNAMADDMLP